MARFLSTFLLAGAIAFVAAAASSAKGSPSGRSLSELDRHFLVAANQANWFEIVSGKMANRRSPTPLGREIGVQIADQHFQAGRTLAEIAARLRFTLPNQLSAPDHWALHAAGTLYGTTFDQRYARLEIAHDAAAIVNAREELRYGSSPAVRGYARGLVPILEAHLKLANQLARSA